MIYHVGSSYYIDYAQELYSLKGAMDTKRFTNSQSWDQDSVVSFFDNERNKPEDVYPSEWFFIKEILHNGMSILDIGCAQGGFANVFQHYLADFDYTGVDISPKMVERAKIRYPEHTFYHVGEEDYSILANRSYDLVLTLGILHLHESWRDTIKVAWKHCKKTLILDFRETELPTLEDKKRSYFTMEVHNGEDDENLRLPYIILNTSDALKSIKELCPGFKKIACYGYTHPVSEYAVTSIKEVMATVYAISR